MFWLFPHSQCRMVQAMWSRLLFLLNYALPAVLSQGELEEAMQWMMMEEVNSYVKGEETQKNQREIDFVLYKRGPSVGAATKVDTPGTIHNGALSPKNQLRICIIGWQNDLNSEFVTSFIDYYTNKAKNFQVVVVNWKGAQMDYVGARRLVDYVSDTVKKYMLRLQNELKFDLSKLIVIGHGLGAQIAGAAGHKLGGKIGNIIALDPMAPLFWENTHDTVNASSALRVIGVHTSAGYLGVYWNVGHVDFWVNRGTAPQPGCTMIDWKRSIVCSHEKSYRYFIEAVENEKAFHSVQCGKKLSCMPPSEKQPLLTGYFYETTQINGQFCFKTNPTSPYSLETEPTAERRRPIKLGQRRKHRNGKNSRRRRKHRRRWLH